MKKIFTALILSSALLAAAAFLPACGGDEKKSSETTDEFASATVKSSGSDSADSGEASDTAQPEAGLLGFESLDLDGNVVTGELFSENKLTMVNIWGTRCPYCIDEMPDLAQLNSDYKDRGFAVLGIITNVLAHGSYIDDENSGAARNIIEATGANYTNIVMTQSVDSLFMEGVRALPTTFFVDQNGNITGKTYLGAKPYEKWAEIIEDLLEEAG